MKRFHVHVSVRDLDQSVRFYATLFGTAPTVLKPDYAKWMLDDPRINFAISARGGNAGVNHLGMQVDSGEELAALEQQLRDADAAMVTEANATCCYVKSDKYWVNDPQGVAWETFRTLGNVPMFGEAPQSVVPGCCEPQLKAPTIAVVTESSAACCPTPGTAAAAGTSCCS